MYRDNSENQQTFMLTRLWTALNSWISPCADVTSARGRNPKCGAVGGTDCDCAVLVSAGRRSAKLVCDDVTREVVADAVERGVVGGINHPCMEVESTKLDAAKHHTPGGS